MTPHPLPFPYRDIYAVQDDCLIAVQDKRPVPDKILRLLPPWRAVMIARIAVQAGVSLECGTVDELLSEAQKVTGSGRLAPTYEESTRT